MENWKQERKARRKKQVRRQKQILAALLLMIVFIVSAALKAETKDIVDNTVQAKESKEVKNTTKTITKKRTLEQVKKDAEEKGYPADVIGLLDKNEETLTFVDNYGTKKNQAYADNIEKDLTPGEIPHLLQWDERWGYASYGTSILAVSGCGPTCMAMVVAGLTQDSSVTPVKLAQYSMEHNYVDEANDTYWTFMENAGTDWNVNCYGGMLDEEQLKAELEAGHPIICSMGPGDFTQNGHFIVMTGYHDGYVSINDPFSITRTEKEWVFGEIADQIKAMWVYSVN